MNELTPSHSGPSQSRGLATSYAFSAAPANAVNLVAMDRKSFQGGPRGSNGHQGAGKQYSSHPQQLQQVNEYHRPAAGPYAATNYPHLKSQTDNRAGSNNGGKFDYVPTSQQYSSHPNQQQQQQQQQQQSFAIPFGYPSYAQNYNSTGDYGQQQQQSSQQQQQHYHGEYAQVGETNPLGMLVSSATNSQAPHEAMPHDHVNIGLKDVGDRKYRQQQQYSVVATDSFLSSSGTYVHGVERPGNMVQLKANSSSQQQQQQQQSMYQRSNMYGDGTAYFSQQQQQVQQQQRTQDTSQPNPLDLVPPSAAMGAGFGTPVNMGRGMNNSVGGMFGVGARMPQFSPGASGASLTTRLKDGCLDVSTGVTSNASHMSFMQQQQPAAKSMEVAHSSTSLYADVSSSTTSMSMVSLSSDGPAAASNNSYPPSSQLGTNSRDACGLCSGRHSDRIASHCGHLFHAQCLHTWGGLTTCPMCAQASNTITSLPIGYGLGADNVSAISQGSAGQEEGLMNAGSGGGGTMNNSATDASSNTVSMTPNSMNSSQITARSTMHMANPVHGGRPPPIDTHTHDNRMGPTTLSAGKRSATSTRSGSSSGGRVRKNKKLKDCSVPGCDRTVRSRGLCKGHGGGRRCGFAGCGLSDQGGGFCISHGGGKRCQHEGCDNSAQSRGLCKLHGGGSRCTVPNCTKSSQGRGLCRAHGGGRRCMVEGCNKTDRRAGYCVTHGADKKCIVPECSKTGRIDNMCTKHYFERHPAQPPGTVSTTPPPVITVNANTSAARARAERKRAVEQQDATNYAGMSSAMLAGPVSAANTLFDARYGGTMTKAEPF